MPDGPNHRRPCRTAGPPADVSVEKKVQFLGRADSYPDNPDRVDIVETHYSWVFLTRCHAYKLKKPAHGEGFDFRDVAARRRNALAEIRLNRRLARGVYLAVVPLCATADGKLAIENGGIPVDWLVKMRRLPAERMFDRRLADHRSRRSDIEPIARHLAQFYARARRATIDPPRFMAQMHREIAAAAMIFSAAGPAHLRSALKPIVSRLNALLTRRAPLFRRRLRERRLVEGHGDLRPEHIYVNGTPHIIDCLEFSAALRRLDPVAEITYLALECRRLGGPPIEGLLLRRYCERTGDAPPRDLVHFYAALNAVIRARIAVRHLADPGTRRPAEWLARAADYLAIASRESRFLGR